VFLILLSLLVVGCMVVSIRRTYVSRLLDNSGVRVRADVVSVFNEAGGGGGGGPRGRGRGTYVPLCDVTYAFDFNGRHFSDTARDVQVSPLRANQRIGRVEATVLPSDPDLHRLETGYRRREWSDTFGGCAFMGLFAAVMGAIGIGLWLPEQGPTPPTAEFFTRPEPFLDLAPPRRLRLRRSNFAWSIVFTALVLIPPAYAGVEWHEYLAHWTPRESIWPWGWGTMVDSVAQGIPYFLVALPAYILRFGRMSRVARLARKGRVTVGVVDWKLKKSRAKPKAVIKINGSAVNGLPDFTEDWVPYRYEVDGRPLTAESADGRSLLSRSISTPVAAYLPTGRQVLVLYDPDRPHESVLVPYAKYYFDFTAEGAADATRPAL